MSSYFLKIGGDSFTYWIFSFSNKIKTDCTDIINFASQCRNLVSSFFFLSFFKACAPPCEMMCQNQSKNCLQSFCAGWTYPLLYCPSHKVNYKSTIDLRKTYEVPHFKFNLYKSAKCKCNLFWKLEEKYSMSLNENLKFCTIFVSTPVFRPRIMQFHITHAVLLSSLSVSFSITYILCTL